MTRNEGPPTYEEATAAAEEPYRTEPHGIADYTEFTTMHHHPHPRSSLVEYDAGKKKKKMHPLIAAAYYNRTKNPLCRLPDGVLVRVMRLLDPVSLECLRRCSRIFLRLFPAACASADDFSTATTSNRNFPWPTSQLKLKPDERARFLSLMARDWYCHDCLSARRMPDWHERFHAATRVYMHCSGCRVDHPACLFSIKQRRHSPWSNRICIGHEGRVRLCEHETVSWPEVVSAAGPGLMQIAADPDTTICRSRRVKQCRRWSHFFDCRHQSDPLAPLKSLMSTTPPPPAISTCCCSPYPSFVVRFPKTDLGTAFAIHLVWSAHLSITLTQNRCLKQDELVRGLARLRRRGAQYICPQIQPGQISGAGLFDPNYYCDHVEYQGREITAWDRSPLFGVSSCCPPKVHFSQIDWQGVRSKHCIPAFGHKVGNCFSDYLKPRPGPWQSLRTEVQGCPNGKNCIRVAHESKATLPLNENETLPEMGKGWYVTLDPDTYDLTDDEEGFGVYWCKANDCKNYYRFNRSRLRPLLRDYWHTCPHC